MLLLLAVVTIINQESVTGLWPFISASPVDLPMHVVHAFQSTMTQALCLCSTIFLNTSCDNYSQTELVQ